MALEGMWTVDFETAAGVRNGGVIVLTGGRILGGDSGMYYVGTYSTVGSTMEGEVQITRYMGQPGMTAWGDDAQALKLELRGAANGKSPQDRRGWPAAESIDRGQRTSCQDSSNRPPQAISGGSIGSLIFRIAISPNRGMA